MTDDFHPPAAIGELVGAPEELRHGLANAATGGVWRVRGTRRSAVLAYETGLAATAYGDAGIVVPEALGVVEREDGGVELWLEDVAGSAGFDWPVPRLARFAYELGVGQARWAGRMPEQPWLSRGWLGQYASEGPARSVRLPPAAWESAPAVAAWPASVRAGLQRLWAERARVLAAAEALPGTLCHLDVWPSNLVDANGRSVLLDWSFVGQGAIGEDVANLIVDSCADGLMDVALLPEIASSCTESYISGLRDGGWVSSGAGFGFGDEDAVRRAVRVCGAAKYCWLGPGFLARALRADTGRTSYGQDDSAGAAVRRVADLVALVAQWADSVLE